jgi:CRISPR-associated protein Cas2
MWMLVMFDLPVITKKERHKATKFRNLLLDNGFEMAQYSVYLKSCSGKEQFQSYLRRIEKNQPRTGSIYVMGFTDKQYENCIRFKGEIKELKQKNPDQLTLF